MDLIVKEDLCNFRSLSLGKPILVGVDDAEECRGLQEAQPGEGSGGGEGGSGVAPQGATTALRFQLEAT